MGLSYLHLDLTVVGLCVDLTGEGSPLRQGAGTGSRLVFVAIEACGGGTPDLGYVLGVSVFIEIFGIGFTSGGVSESSTRQGPTPRGVGAPPTLVDSPGLFWPNSFTPGASFGP